MVAVVSGNGLGLFNTSLTQLGASQGGMAGIGGSRTSNYVNLATGNLVLTGYDESLFGQGFATGLVRTYNSQGSFGQAGADGWQTGYERTVRLASGTENTAGSTVERAMADGSVVTYTWEAGRSAYVSTTGEGAHDTIVLSGSGGTAKWLWTEGSTQVQETYDASSLGTAGKLEQIVDLATGASYVLAYSSGLLSTITGANGETLEFGYDGSNRLISVGTRERDAGGTLSSLKSQVSYGYDAAGRLSWVQTDLTPDNNADNTWDGSVAANNDGKRYRVTYTYEDASSLRVTGVTTSDGLTIGYTYDGSGRIASVTQGGAGDGSTQTLTYTYNSGSTDVTDAAGRTWTYQYDANKQLTAVLEPAVGGQRAITEYTYDAEGNVTRIRQAAYAGATSTLDTVFQYDANGNVTLQRDRLGNTITRTYTAANRIETEARYITPDADGLDPTHAGTTNLPSGALITRYIYDTTNPRLLRFVINAAGEVSENQYHASGVATGLVSLSRRFTGATYDTSGLGATAVPTLAQMTTWVSGKEGQSARTDFSYDAQGRLTQRNDYATVDGSGNGTLDAATSITRYTYDAQGLLRQQVMVRGASRTLGGAAPNGSEVVDYLYDGMGRLLSSIRRDSGTASNDDANTVTTVTAYVDSAKQIVITLDAGAVRTEVRNAAGMLVSVSEANAASGATITRTTQNYYDATGRLRAVQDASNERTYFFYDAAGRLSATVDATGAVTQTQYDAIGRVTGTTGYATRVITTSWFSAGAVTKDTLIYAASSPTLAGNEAWVQTDAANDRAGLTRVFDDAGRLLHETDVAGLRTAYAYDGAGRLLSTTVSKPGDGTVTARVTRFFYDSADRLVATLDAAGYLSETIYDAGGRAVQTIRYANLTNSSYWASGTLAQLRPAANATNDQSTRLFYDYRGNQVAVLNAEGYLTEFVYDEGNNQRAVKAYAKKLTGLSGSESLATLRTSALTSPPSEAYRQTLRSFNGLGQLATEVSATYSSTHTLLASTVTRYSYDEAGRLLRTEAAQGTSEVRENYARYDVFGQLIGEVSGEQAALAIPQIETIKNNGALTEAQKETAYDAVYAQYGVRHSYNLLGQRTESVDATGAKTFYFYDAAGRQTFTVRGVKNSGGVANAQGEVTETRYSAFGQVTDQLAYTGRITITTPGDRASVQTAITALSFAPASDTRRQFVYDQRGLLTRSTDAEGTQTNTSYTAFGQAYEVTTAYGTALAATTRYAYDNRGLMSSRIEAQGTGLARTTSQTVDAFGRTVTSTDGRGIVSTITYDRLGRQVSLSRTVSGQVETSDTFSYDAFDRVVTQTDARGQATTYAHSDTARSVVVTTPEGVSVTTVHNRFGQTVTVSQTMPGSGGTATTTTTYDKNGNVLTVTDALGNVVVTNTYDVRAQLLETTDATGRKIGYTYAAVGRVLTRVEDPGSGKLNLTTTYAYDGQGRQLTVTDPTNRVTQFSYDREGRLTQVAKDPAGLNLLTVTTYDALGRTLTVTEGYGTSAATTVQYAYDALNRRTSEVVDPGAGKLNLTTSYAYDANDNLVTRTDGLGKLTRYAYDEANRMRFVVDATGGIVETVYDKNGNAIVTRGYAKALTPASLSALANAPTISAIQSLITSQSLKNDAADQLAYRVLDRDNRVRFTLDAVGTLSEVRYDSAGRALQTLVYASAFTTASVLTKLRNGTAVESDFASFVTSNEATARASTQVYDNAGRVVYTLVRSDATQAIVSERRYDAAGRVVADVVFAKTITYAVGQTTAQILSALTTAGATAANQQRLTQYTYDAVGRLHFTLDDAGAVSEQQYDAAGRVASTRQYLTPVVVATVTDANVQAAIVGQTNPRITSQAYDNAGRLISTTDALNQTEHYGYDAASRRISFKNKLDKEWNYEYDAAGRLTTERTPEVAVARFNGSGAVVIDSLRIVTKTAYDALGNVTSRTENAEAEDVNERRTTQYLYDAAGRQIKTIFPDAWQIDVGGNLVATGVQPEIQISYDALGRAVVQKDVRGNYSYKIYDAQGRVAYDIDAGGNVTTFSYNSFGEQTGLTRHAAAFDFSKLSGWTAGSAITLSQVTVSATANTATITTSAANDRTMTVTLDALGRKIAIVEHAVSYYKADGTVATGSPTTQFVYDATGNLVKQSVLLEGTAGQGDAVWAHTYNYYDELGRRTLSVDAEGYVTAWSYDALGQLTEQFEHARAVPTATLTTAAPPALPTAGDVATGYDRGVMYVYDALGRKLSETVLRLYQNADGSSAVAEVATDYEYDVLGHVTAVTTGENRTETDYDVLGRASAVREQERQVLVSNWQDLLEASTGTNLSSASLYVLASPHTAMSYDAFGNVVKFVRSGAGEVNGVVTASANDQVATTRYDRQGRAVLSTDLAGKIVTTTYDAADNIIGQSYRLTDRLGHNATIISTYTYDAAGRQTSQRQDRLQYSGTTVTDAQEAVKYNAFGEILAKAETAANLGDSALSVQYEYDAAGRIVRSNAEAGAFRRYGYNLAGMQIREERDWNDAGTSRVVVFKQSVDKLGRVIKVVSPSYTSDLNVTATTLRRLDRWGNVLEQTDARGYNTQFFYNDQNKLIRQLAPLVKVVSEAGVDTWQRPETRWLYDQLGRLIKEIDANGHARSYTYNDANQLIATTDATAAVTKTAYDARGQALATQNALGYLTYVDYDLGGRAIAQGDFLADTAGTAREQKTLQSFTLDQDGNRLTVTDALGNVLKYDYDGRGKLLRSETATGVVMTYAYDARGNRTTENYAVGGQSWTYDYFGRMTAHSDLSGGSFTYTYDALSGLMTGTAITNKSRSMTYYANGQVRSLTEGLNLYLFEYDAAGNRTLEETTTKDGGNNDVHVATRTYYDSLGRISRVTSDDLVLAVRMLDVSYDYDAVGNRRRVVADAGYGPDVLPVSMDNRAPIVVAAPANQPIESGVVFSWSVRATDVFRDPENTAMTYSLTKADGSAAPSWLSMSYDAETGLLTFSATAGSSANLGQAIGLKLSARDQNGAGLIADASFSVNVFGNQAPIVANTIPNQSATVNQAWSFPFAANTFSDPDGQTLSYSATGLPAGVSFDAATRTFSGTVTATGTYSITVTASDGALSVSDTFDLVVGSANQPPIVLNTIPNQTTSPTLPAVTWTYTFPANTFSDTDALTYTQTGMPAWMSFNASTRTFSGAGDRVGSWTITVKATDTAGQHISTSFTVTGPNVAPMVITPIPDKTATVGQAFTYTFPSTTFDDPNYNQSLTYAASGMPPGITFSPALRKFSGTPTTGGTYTVTVTASDGSLTVSDTFDIVVSGGSNQAPTVANAIPDQTATAGQSWGFTFAANTFSDPEGQTLTYTASGMPSGVTFNASTRTFSGTPASAGTYAITVTASDGSLSVSDVFNVVVGSGGNQAPTVANAIPDQYGVKNQAFSYTFPANTFSDPNGDTLTYTAIRVNSSGVQQTWPPYLTFNASTRTFSGTPGTTRTDIIRVTASDGTLTVYDDFVITIENSQGFMAGGGSSSMQAAYSQMAGDSMQPMSLDPGGEGGEGGGGGGGGSGGTTPNHQELWFTYDAANRVLVTNGTMNNGVIVISGDKSWAQVYNAAGYVTGKYTVVEGATKIALSEVDLRGQTTKDFHAATIGGTNGVAKTYGYDAAGHLTQTTEWYALDETKQGRVTEWDELGQEFITYFTQVPIGGWLKHHEVYTYDGDGRLLTLTETGRVQGWVNDWAQLQELGGGIDPGDVAQQQTDLGVLDAISLLTYTNDSGTTGYDSNGRLVTHRYIHYSEGEYATNQNAGYTITYNHSYIGRDGWIESSVSADADLSTMRDGVTTSIYDVWGKRNLVTEITPLPDYETTLTNKRYFAYDANGAILVRRDGVIENNEFVQSGNGNANNVFNPAPLFITSAQWAAMTETERKSWQGKALNQHFVYSNGQQVGHVNEAGMLNVADKLTAFDSNAMGTSQVTVNDGDTLQTLAQRVYGNASLWYVLAQANAVTDSELFTGQVLAAPKVTTNKNDATTFKPYNPAETTGPTQPSTPYIAKAPQTQCDALIMVTMILVVVFVSALTFGQAAPAASTAMAPAASAGATTATTIFTVGANGISIAGGVVGGAAAGAASAAASGVINSTSGYGSFSWRSVAAGAVTGAITGGMAGAQLGSVGQALKDAALGKAVLLAAANAAAGYIGQRVAGMDVTFSWKNIAAQTVSSVVAAGIGIAAGLNPNEPFTGSGSFWADVGNNAIEGIVSTHVRRAFGFDDEIHYGKIALDAFGNAIGNAWGNSMVKGIRDNRILSIAKEAGYELRRGEDGRLHSTFMRLNPDGTPVLGLDGKPMYETNGLSVGLAIEGMMTAGGNRSQIVAALKNDDYRNAISSIDNASYWADVGITYVGPVQIVRTDELTAEQRMNADEASRFRMEANVDVARKEQKTNMLAHVANVSVDTAEFVADQASEHPYLTTVAVAGLQAAFTGGPIKTGLVSAGKELLGTFVSELSGPVRNAIVGSTSSFMQEEVGLREFPSKLLGQGAGFGFDMILSSPTEVIAAAKKVKDFRITPPVRNQQEIDDALDAFSARNLKPKLIRVNGYDIDSKWLNDHGDLEWLDPITNQRRTFAAGEKVSIDHMLARTHFNDDMFPGFSDLPKDVQKGLINNPANLRPMSQAANSSKGKLLEGFDEGFKTFRGVPVHTSYRAELLAQQAAMQKLVNDAIRKNKGGW